MTIFWVAGRSIEPTLWFLCLFSVSDCLFSDFWLLIDQARVAIASGLVPPLQTFSYFKITHLHIDLLLVLMILMCWMWKLILVVRWKQLEGWHRAHGQEWRKESRWLQPDCAMLMVRSMVGEWYPRVFVYACIIIITIWSGDLYSFCG